MLYTVGEQIAPGLESWSDGAVHLALFFFRPLVFVENFSLVSAMQGSQVWQRLPNICVLLQGVGMVYFGFHTTVASIARVEGSWHPDS